MKVLRYVDGLPTMVQLTDQDVQSLYTPTNYTPVPVGSEPSDMVSAHLKGLDAKLGNLSPVDYTTQYFTGNDAIDTFTLTKVFTIDDKVDVWINGLFQEEDEAWERNATNNTVTTLMGGFPSDLPDQARMLTRVYNESFSHVDEGFDSTGVETTFSPTNIFSGSTAMDLYIGEPIGGYKLGVENVDWRRNTVGQTIIPQSEGVDQAFPAGTRVVLRLNNLTPQEESFVGGVSEVQVGTNFEADSLMDVFFDGLNREEGTYWSRDESTNKINILVSTDSNTKIRVRIWSI
jgi:hypothetical protein